MIAVVALMGPLSFAHAQTQSGGTCESLKTNGLGGVVNCVILLLDYAAIAILALSVLYTMWGAFLMASSEEKRQQGKDIVIFGIIGIFVMTSIWGLVNILQSTFGLEGGPITPTKIDRTPVNIQNPLRS